MSQKRLRIFAGPNGSVKSSLLNRIPDSVPLGYYINADEIEKKVISDKGISLDNYGITSSMRELRQFLENSEFAKIKSDIRGLLETFIIYDNVLKTVKSNLLPKYSAAIISEFIRERAPKAGLIKQTYGNQK